MRFDVFVNYELSGRVTERLARIETLLNALLTQESAMNADLQAAIDNLTSTVSFSGRDELTSSERAALACEEMVRQAGILRLATERLAEAVLNLQWCVMTLAKEEEA